MTRTQKRRRRLQIKPPSFGAGGSPLVSVSGSVNMSESLTKAPFGQNRPAEEGGEMDWMAAIRMMMREENEKSEQKIIIAMEARMSLVETRVDGLDKRLEEVEKKL